MDISVVCPTYNSAGFVEKTLDSIISQNVLPNELIIVDDGSSDNTIEVIENFFREHQKKIAYKIIQNSHQGPGAARNAAIKRSTAKWIAFIDSDDIWYPEKISHIQDLINKNKDINFICHNEIHVKNDNKRKPIDYSKKFNANEPLFGQLYKSNLFSTSAVVCRKDLLMNHGLFDENLMSAQDYELWLRLSRHINVLFTKNILGEYVVREGNITSSSIIRRFKNEIKIAQRYAEYFKYHKFIKRVTIIILSYIKQFFQRWI